MILGACGCAPKPEPEPVRPEAGLAAPTYEELAEEHDQRVAGLGKLYANGTITLRWTDDAGSHAEQADLELWVDLQANGPRTAMRIQKGAIGEEFVRLGADAKQAWLLDLRADEKVLYRARGDQPFVADSSLPITISPWALLDLLALTAIPQKSAGATEAVRFDAERDAWMVSAPGRSGPMRIFFDRRTLRPTRVELLSPSGQVRYFSQMKAEDYESVERDGVSPAEFAKLPMRIRLFDAALEDNSASISLGETTGRASDPRMNEKVFDLERLLRQFNPRVVEEPTSASSR